MEARIASLERSVRQLRTLSGVLLALLLAVGVVGFRVVPRQAEVLRVRGLVIVDSLGRDRILIGAPIPQSHDRVRTDSSRVRTVWAKRFPNPDQYMGYYRAYRHSTDGILILDEAGFDRLALGDPVPDPNIGKRLGPETGLVINDSQGFEVSGYGLLSVDDQPRVVLGMDSDDGEALSLSVLENGRRGLAVRNPNRNLFLGIAPAGDRIAGSDQSLFGLELSEKGREPKIIDGFGKPTESHGS